MPTNEAKIAIPFENMAISLSGGGYRATTFHLGALSYLDSRLYGEKELLQNVKIVSTISGGTLTGVMYALKLAQGKSFLDCYQKLYLLLKKDRLVDHALEKLNKPKTWENTNKTRDVINAFAEVYNEEFYDKATFEELFDGKKSHLEDVIFGSSEFTHGLQFRFQEDKANGKFGNYYLNLPIESAKKIRLADAAASSSCFPGGFEPMIMPRDYGNGKDNLVVKSWEEKNYQPTGIMDGGIIDNQGIEGVKLAEQRNKTSAQDFIGTYIISDVTSQKMIPYPVPIFKNNGLQNLLSVKLINVIFSILSVIFVAGLATDYFKFYGIIASTVFLTLFAAWFIGYFIITKIIRKTITSMFGYKNSPELLEHLGVINKTPIYVLIYLIKLRVTSVMQMVSDIFLRRIRTLQLGALFTSKDWNYRIKPNNIYTLSDNDTLPETMQDIVKTANNMPTTLWFSEKEKKANTLEKLIACGQFSLCKNLMDYIDGLKKAKTKERVWDQLDSTSQNNIDQLRRDLEEDWKTFLVDPFWLVNDYNEKMKFKG